MLMKLFFRALRDEIGGWPAQISRFVGCFLGYSVVWALPVMPMLAWAELRPAQQTVAQDAKANDARASDVRAAVRLQQAAKNAQLAGVAAQKAEQQSVLRAQQQVDQAKRDERHLNEQERVQLRQQLARELRAQNSPSSR